MTGVELGPAIAQGRTSEVFAIGTSKMLKLFRPQMPRGAADYEWRIAQTLNANAAPALHAFEFALVQGRAGIIYERVNGESMLQRLRQRPWQARRLAHLMADAHAAIHAVSATDLPGLPSQRERMCWQLHNVEALSNAEKARIQSAIESLPGGSALCHGDFHPDNIPLTTRGIAIIDWNNATAGNPNGDVAWTLLLFTYATPADIYWPLSVIIGSLQRAFRAAYLSRYLEVTRALKRDIDVWRVPITAVRLADGIAAERSALLQAVRGGIADLYSASA